MKTILDLYPHLKKKSHREYAGPCPWCGGRDRFIVWPNNGKGGRFYCRQCNERGDAIDFLRHEGFSYRQAAAALCLDLSFSSYSLDKVEEVDLVGVEPFSSAKLFVTDFKLWQESAARFVEQSIRHRCPTINSDWSNALKGRCLTMTFAKQHGIGWNPRDEYFPSQRWGMSGGKIRIPKGLVITHRGENEILSIKIRCANTDQGPKYWQVRGSSDKCLILGTLGTPAVIVESELDAYLICQEVQGRIGVVSLGGTSKILDEDALTYLKQAPKVLIATDYDEPNLDAVGVGQKAFFKLREYFPMAEYLPPARGKDPCEMHAQGIPISLWLECASGATDSSKDLCLPPGYRGNVENLQKLLAQFPHLVPCPLTSPQWYWRYRTDCRTCEGHVHCLKDFPKAAESPPNTPGITVDMS